MSKNISDNPALYVGVVPYIESEDKERKFMVFCFADKFDRDFMLCKGKRLIKDKHTKKYRKYTDIDFPIDEKLLEPSDQAARREAEEELGFVIPESTTLDELGVAGFSAFDKKNNQRVKIPIILYTAHLSSKDVSEKTIYKGIIAGQETIAKWVTFEEFRHVGRLEHVVILGAIEEALNEEN